MKVMVIPHAHHRHNTNFLDLQGIKNTSMPNTQQLAQM